MWLLTPLTWLMWILRVQNVSRHGDYSKTMSFYKKEENLDRFNILAQNSKLPLTLLQLEEEGRRNFYESEKIEERHCGTK